MIVSSLENLQAMRNGADAGDEAKAEVGTVATNTAEVAPTEPVGALPRTPTPRVISLLADSLVCSSRWQEKYIYC